MSKVFVFGGAGFIGAAVALAFRLKGYSVYCLVRSEQKAKIVKQIECIPVIGSAQDTKSWESVANHCDIIVEAMSDYQDHSAGVTLQKVLEGIAKNDKKKIVIYTSGCWVYGNTTKAASEDDVVLENVPTLVKSRPQLEKSYTDFGAVVIRAAVVFGKQGSITAMWFKGLKGGKLEFPGNGSNVNALVHVDDLADLYVRAAETPEKSRGQIFNANGTNERVSDCVNAVLQATGLKAEVKWTAPTDLFTTCLAMDQRLSSKKAKILLGWNPKRQFLGAPGVYYNAWDAISN